MRLASRARTAVELDIVGYEQPAPAEPSEPFEPSEGDERYEWLLIRGRFVDPSGQWTFQNACLATDDASELHAWLAAVADGLIEPSDGPGSAR